MSNLNDGHVMKQAAILEKLDKLERLSSHFKHSVPAIIDFWLETVMESLRRLNTAAL